MPQSINASSQDQLVRVFYFWLVGWGGDDEDELL